MENAATPPVSDELGVLIIILSLLGLAFVFNSICIVCDDYLVVAIEVLICDFKLPEEVAGVTLVAFASAAPEILLNSVSALQQQSSLSLPASLGSSIIAFGLIPSCCILLTDYRYITIETSPIIREV